MIKRGIVTPVPNTKTRFDPGGAHGSCKLCDYVYPLSLLCEDKYLLSCSNFKPSQTKIERETIFLFLFPLGVNPSSEDSSSLFHVFNITLIICLLLTYQRHLTSIGVFCVQELRRRNRGENMIQKEELDINLSSFEMLVAVFYGWITHTHTQTHEICHNWSRL